MKYPILALKHPFPKISHDAPREQFEEQIVGFWPLWKMWFLSFKFLKLRVNRLRKYWNQCLIEVLTMPETSKSVFATKTWFFQFTGNSNLDFRLNCVILYYRDLEVVCAYMITSLRIDNRNFRSKNAENLCVCVFFFGGHILKKLSRRKIAMNLHGFWETFLGWNKIYGHFEEYRAFLVRNEQNLFFFAWNLREFSSHFSVWGLFYRITTNFGPIQFKRTVCKC